MSSVDARKAKVGDRIEARVTKNVKEHGRVVIHKGNLLVGHVTSIEAGVAGRTSSRLGMKFDQLLEGNSTTRLNTIITSVFYACGSGQAGGSESMEPPSMPAPVMAPAGGNRGGGGLVGGVGSTVGSTAGAAGSALGQAGGELGATAQNTLGTDSAVNLGTPARQIHLGSQASADSSVGTTSMLSTRKGDLRLESGTEMQFRVAASSSAASKRK